SVSAVTTLDIRHGTAAAFVSKGYLTTRIYPSSIAQRVNSSLDSVMPRRVRGNGTQLDIDIDLRIGVAVWTDVLDSLDGKDVELLGSLLRLVYGLGYYDALTEPKRGSLCSDNGFAIPQRRSPASSS